MKKKIKQRIALTIKKLQNLHFTDYGNYLHNDSLIIKFWDGSPNWGDSLNPYLIGNLMDCKILIADRIFNFLNKEAVLGVGSILSGDVGNYVIWGSGFLSEKSTIVNKPRHVLAVRGHLTANKLRKLDIKVPEIYGDPALLFPRIFYPVVTKKFKLGIIPHFKENDLPLIGSIKQKFGEDICIIDMRAGIEEVAEMVLSCEIILSSSLHGLILAEAYGIPTGRVVMSNHLIGGDFKFNDYYSGVGISNHSKLVLNEVQQNLSALIKQTSLKDLKFDGNQLRNSLANYLLERAS